MIVAVYKVLTDHVGAQTVSLSVVRIDVLMVYCLRCVSFIDCASALLCLAVEL